MLYKLNDKVEYVKQEIYDIVCRSQSWMGLDMIIGGIDELMVETIWSNLGDTPIDSFAAYASFKNRRIHQKLSIEDALLFWKIRNLMFNQYEILKENRDIDRVSDNIYNSRIPGFTDSAKYLVVDYFKTIASALPYQEKQDKMPDWVAEYTHEYTQMKREWSA